MRNETLKNKNKNIFGFKFLLYADKKKNKLEYYETQKKGWKYWQRLKKYSPMFYQENNSKETLHAIGIRSAKNLK